MPSLDVAINALRAKAGAQEFDSAVKKIQQGAKNVDSSVKQTNATMGIFDASAKKMAVNLIGIATAYKGMRFAISSVKELAAFEMGLANVSTMLDETSMKYMPKYEKQIGQLARKYGESTGTLTKGLYDILSASIGAGDAIKLLEVSSKAAIGGISSTGVAADALTTIINSYNLSAKDASDVSDLLFTTVKGGKITFEEIAGSIGHVAALAASAGLTLEDMSAAIATMTRSGLQADIAITSLKGILTTFLSPTKESIDVAKKLGIELNSNTLRTVGLIGVMEKLKYATDEDVAAIFSNVRALTGVAALRQNVTGLMDDQEKALNRLGKAEEAYQKIAETTAMKIRQMQEDWKAVKREVGSFSLQIISFLPELWRTAEAFDEVRLARERFKRGGVDIIKIPDIEFLKKQNKEVIEDLIKTLEDAGQHVPGPIRQLLEPTIELVQKLKEEEEEILSINARLAKLVPSINLPEELEKVVKIREEEIKQEELVKGIREKYFGELEFEKNLIGKTTEERERAIKAMQYEAEAKKLGIKNIDDLIKEYEKELEKLGEAYEAAEFYEKIREGMGALIRSPLTALLDETRDIGEVFEDELKNLGTSILESMYQEMITKPLQDSLMKALTPVMDAAMDILSGVLSGAMKGVGSLIGDALFPVAGEKGLIFSNAGVKKFDRGGILTRPTLFPMSNGGVGLGGEAGKEAIMPLTRTPSGDLGVKTDGATTAKTSIKIINIMDYSQVQEYLSSGDGERQIVNVMRRNRDEIQL